MSRTKENTRILGGISWPLLEALEFQLLHIVAEHLKVVDPVVASQHADESADNVRKQRRLNRASKRVSAAS